MPTKKPAETTVRRPSTSPWTDPFRVSFDNQQGESPPPENDNPPTQRQTEPQPDITALITPDYYPNR